MIKIFSASWHLSHQFSLLQIPNTQWSFLINNVRGQWNTDVRPQPKNLDFVANYESGEYDLAVLDVDQQCVDPLIGKGQLYRDLNEVIQDIPKIVINHGTPWWPERWETYGPGSWALPLDLAKAKREDIEKFQVNFLINGGKVVQSGQLVEIEGMKKLIGNNTMVVNSYQAKKDWGWGEVIIHGLDPNDWWNLPKEPRCVVSLSPGGLDSYYGRELLMRTGERLYEKYGLRIIHIGNPYSWVIERHPRFREIGGWGAYRDFLGRSLVYFNPTQHSPNPRSRLEAMLSGCCVLSTPYQDADSYFNLDTKSIWQNCEGVKEYIDVVDRLLDVEGITGIIIPDNPEPISALINHLIYRRFKTAERIGAEGRKFAIKNFSKEKFDNAWSSLIERTLK